MSKMYFSEVNPTDLLFHFFPLGIYEVKWYIFQCHGAVTLQSITLKEGGSKPLGCAEILNTLPQQGVCVVSASSIIALEVKTGERPTTVKPPPHSCKLLINC